MKTDPKDYYRKNINGYRDRCVARGKRMKSLYKIRTEELIKLLQEVGYYD